MDNVFPNQSILQYSNQMHVIYFQLFFLPNLSDMFRCVTHHPQGEFRKRGQISQLFTRLLHKLYYKVYYICRLSMFFYND